LAWTPEQMQKHMAQVFGLFQAPTDIGFMTAGAHQYLELLGRTAVVPKTKTIY